MMENVSAIHNKKNIDNFNLWLDTLKDLGYSSYWQDCNAKDYGAPQNRQRTFILSILGNYTYEFPKPIPLTKRLKDVLDENVPEEYYINSEKAQQLIEKLIIDGTLPFKENKSNNPVLLKNQSTEFVKEVDVANTIMARDWKGAGNQEFCHVIEEQNETKL